MHPRHRLLAFLLFNLLWAIALFSFVYRSHSSKPGEFRAATVLPEERAEWGHRDALGPHSVMPRPALPPRPVTWRDLESEEYAAYLKRLRDAGCPEPKVRQILVADVNERTAVHRLEIALANDPSWWRADAAIATLPAFPDVNHSLEQERRALLEKLLGSQWAESDRTAPLPAGGVLLTGQVLGSLTPEKHNAVQEILASTSARLQDYLLARSNEGQLPNPVELARQREQTQGDLSQVLSPLELDEFLIRYSEHARQLRQQLRAFVPTPDEFRKIFQLTDPIDRQWQRDYGDASALSVKQRQEYERQRDRALQQALTPRRYEAARQGGDATLRPAQAMLR